MRLRAILSASVLITAGFTAATASGADADTTAWLNLQTFSQMVVDSTHDQLFLTGLDEVLVTDFSGKTLAVVTGSVAGIALSPDGSTVYVAEGGKVVAISTATLQQTAQYSMGGSGAAQNVAVQSGKLWVSYRTGPTGAAIGDFDLSAASPTLEAQSAMGGWAVAPLLAADPSDTGVLVAMETDQDPTSVASYDTTRDPVTVRALTASLVNSASKACTAAYDLAVVPGGAQFIPACGTPQNLTRYSTADLSAQGTYGPVVYPSAIAIASGTGLVATASEEYTPGPYVFTPGSDTPVNILPGGPSPRGVGLTADGSELFEVTFHVSSFQLKTYQNPSAGSWSLTMAPVSSSVTVGRAVQLTGTLAVGGTIPPPGTPITVTRTGPDGIRSLSASTVSSSGSSGGTFALTDTPPASGTYTYLASYADAATGETATASATVTVVPKPKPTLAISVTPATSAYQTTLRITVLLGTKNGDRTVSVYTQPAGSTTRTLVTTAAVSATGSLTLTYRAAHTTTFSAIFAGDSDFAPASASATAQVSAAVSLKLAGYYTTKQVGGVIYRLYHRTSKLSAVISVSPNKKGECARLQVQEYYSGAWHASTTTTCIALGKNSTAPGFLALSRANHGHRYRIRADYQRGSDNTNLNADSAWQYFAVEK
jgi:hypothetical protein